MGKSFERYQKRKLISSYFSVTLTIGIVLFLVGVLGLLIFNAHRLANYFKEQVSITVFLKDGANELEITQLQKSVALAAYTKTVTFVSKEEAAANFGKEIGEDFINFIGNNPLQHSLDIHLKADYVLPETLETIAAELGAREVVSEVSYDKPLIALLNENVRRMSVAILIASGMLALIAVLLINSSIRLSIYSNRFIIKTMQLVGATKQFIRRPFIVTHIKLGVVGAITAVLLLAFAVYYLDNRFPELTLGGDPLQLTLIFGGMVVLGILLSGVSTFLATQRFLNVHTDDVH